MPIFLAIIILIALFLIYKLLISGWLWKILMGIFGFLGMFWTMKNYIPHSGAICLTVGSYPLSWAIVVPMIILLITMIYTKE